MINFAIIGAGWRSEFYLRVAKVAPSRFRVAGIYDQFPQVAQRLSDKFQIRAFSTLKEMLTQGAPDFVVACVPRTALPSVLRQVSEYDLPILSETPPGSTMDDLFAVWEIVCSGARIQVAEQYWAQPHQAARLAFAESGKLGRITEVQVSIAHGYHGISLMRRYLGVRYEPVTITAHKFVAPIVEGPGRSGLPDNEKIIDSTQVIAWFDFGNRLGVYDFTLDQYFSFIRGQRLVVRGQRGEIIDMKGVYLQDHLTPINVDFSRHSAGSEGNLEGNYLKGYQAGGEWIYRNPFSPAVMSDDEVAIATCLIKMKEYVKTKEEFYSVAEACQDRYLDILMTESVAKGIAVTSSYQPWNTA